MQDTRTYDQIVADAEAFAADFPTTRSPWRSSRSEIRSASIEMALLANPAAKAEQVARFRAKFADLGLEWAA